MHHSSSRWILLPAFYATWTIASAWWIPPGSLNPVLRTSCIRISMAGLFFNPTRNSWASSWSSSRCAALFTTQRFHPGDGSIFGISVQLSGFVSRLFLVAKCAPRHPNSSGVSLPCVVCIDVLASKTKIWSPPPNRYADTYTSAPYGKIWFFFTVVCVSTSPFPHCAQLMIIIPFRYMPQFNPNVFTILSRVVFHGFGLLNASS